MKTDPTFRSDFEVAILFHPDVTRRGFTARKKDGTYQDEDAELMYSGYCIARQNDYGRLARFDPARSIPVGLMTEVNQKLLRAGQMHVTEETIRIVLAVVGSSPS